MVDVDFKCTITCLILQGIRQNGALFYWRFSTWWFDSGSGLPSSQDFLLDGSGQLTSLVAEAPVNGETFY